MHVLGMCIFYTNCEELYKNVHSQICANNEWFTFDTNGHDLDALRLSSMTLTSESLIRNWMLRGPVIANSLAILRVASYTWNKTSYMSATTTA